MSDEIHLPAKVEPGALAPASPTHLVPALIAAAGDASGWRFIDFFTANIRNPNTRRAYVRASVTFFTWCEARGLTLGTIRPFDVATYIESLQQTHPAPTVKQQLAAVRMLFDWLVTGQVVLNQPGRSGARAEARGKDRQDAGARGRGMATADRQHSDRYGA